MKFIIVCMPGIHHVGGVESYINTMNKYLKKIDIKATLISIGSDFILDSARNSDPREIIDRFILASYKSIKKELSKTSEQFIVNTHWFPEAIPAIKLKKEGFTFSHFLTVHDQLNNLSIKYFEYVIRNIKYVDKFIVLNEFMNDYLVSRGIPSEKIEIIKGGVDLELFNIYNLNKDTLLNLKNRLSVCESDKIILLPVRMDPIKNIHVAVEMLSYVIKEFSNVKLLLTANGSFKESWIEPDVRRYREYIIQLIDKFKLRNNIVSYKWLKEKPNKPIFSFQEMPYVYSLSHLTLLPSKIEPFGFVILESMAMGKPVIASKSGGPEKVIINKHNGILCNPNDPHKIYESVCELLENEKLYRKIVKNGFKTVKNYGMDNVIKKIIKLAYT